MFLCRTVLLLILPLLVSCAWGNASLWTAYTFDGTKFSPAAETISPNIWLRNGYVPIIAPADPGSAGSDRLSPGSGAVAGICYRLASGGKLAGPTSFSPYPGEQVTFKNNTDGTTVARTDENGYFSEQLAAGGYNLFCRGVRAAVTVTEGKTTLVPIRGGKRMAD